MIAQHGDHVVITFDRPHKRNSMDLAAWTSLGQAAKAARAAVKAAAR